MDIEKQLKKVSFIDLAGNILLTIIKFIAGTLSHSAALLSDAVHSASDVFSTLVMFIGIKVSTKEPDKKYPYGYEKIESITAIIMSMILLSAGFSIGISGIEKIIAGTHNHLSVPGIFALITAIFAVLTKEGMFWYIHSVAKKTNSQAMLAEAWHQRTDALASIGSVVGILGARLGFPILDPIASIVIALFIVKTASTIFMEATHKIIDKAVDDETIEEIKNLLLTQDGVLAIHSVRGKYSADSIRVEVGIYANGEMSIAEASEIKECIKYNLMQQFPHISRCTINIYPMKNNITNRKTSLKNKWNGKKNPVRDKI